MAAPAPAADADLTPLVDAARATALNTAAGSPPPSRLFAEGADPAQPPLRSDADAQLIVTVPFLRAVRLTGVALRAEAGAEPCALKLFLDREAFTFEDVASSRAAAELPAVAAAAARAGRLLPLPGAHKLPPCRSVTVFLDGEPAGAEVLALTRLVFFGRAADGAGIDVTKLTAG